MEVKKKKANKAPFPLVVLVLMNLYVLISNLAMQKNIFYHRTCSLGFKNYSVNVKLK